MTNTKPQEALSHLYVLLLKQKLSTKIRDHLVQQLIKGGIDIFDPKLDAIARSRLDHGISIRNQWLHPFLDQAENSLLDAQQVFGFLNYNFSRRMYLPLAFGADIGTLLYSRFMPAAPADPATHADPIAGVCGVFNFAISIFDRACDHNDPKALHAIFNQDMLISVFESPENVQKISDRAKQLDNPELALLLRIICVFFTHVYALVNKKPSSTKWENFTLLITQAYHAQLSTLQSKSIQPRDAMQISYKKSCLPFLIMAELVRLAGDNHSADKRITDTNELSREVESIARIFWELDDLIDLPEDLFNGDINSVVLSFESCETPADLAEMLLQSPELPRRITRFCQQLAELSHRLDTFGPGHIDHIPYSDLLLAYVQSWITAQ